MEKMEIGLQLSAVEGLDQRIAHLRRVMCEVDDTHVYTSRVQSVNVAARSLPVARGVKNVGIIK